MKARTIKAIRDDPNNVFISFSDGSTYRFHHWAYKESYELVYYSTSGKDVIYSEGHYFSLYKGQVETWQSKSLWRNEQYCGYVYTKSRKILSHVSQIVTGIGRTYFLMLDGTVKTCGRTDDPKGVLGLGELSNSEKPVTIPGLAKVKKISTANMYYGQVLFLHYDGTVSGCVIQEHPRFLSGSEDYPKNTDIVKIKGLSSILDIVAGPTNFLTHMDGSIYYFNKISPLPTFWKMIGVTNVTKIIYSYFDILYILNTGQVMYLNSEFCYSRLVADRKFLPELNNIKDGFIHSHPSKGLLAFFVNSEHKLILYSLRKKKIIKDAMTDGIPTANQLAEFGKCVPKRAKKLLERILADPEEFKSVITSDNDLKLLGNIFPGYPVLKQPDTKAALHWLVTKKNELTKVRIVSRALWQGSIDPNCFFAKKKDRKEIPHEILIKIATHASDSAYVSEKDAEKEALKSFCRPSL